MGSETRTWEPARVASATTGNAWFAEGWAAEVTVRTGISVDGVELLGVG